MTYISQAIATRFLGPTNTKPSRIKAKAWGGSIIIPYPYDLGLEAAHRVAAEALMKKMGWTGTYAQGGGASGEGYVFVNIEGA